MTQSQELTIITPADLKSAGTVLTQSTGWVESYRKKQAVLVAAVSKCESGKLTPELDEKINAYLVSSKTCLNKMNADRTPYTQKANEFVKMFTSLENTIGKDLYAPLQAARDASAKIYAEEEREKQKEEQLKLQKEQLRITLTADAEEQVRNAYADILKSDKDEYMQAFSGCTADTIDEVEAILASVDAIFKIDLWDSIVPVLSSPVHTKEELDNIIVNAKAGKFDLVAPHYKSEIDKYAKLLHSMIPERRKEIKEGKESEAAAELAKKQADLAAAQQAAIDAKVAAEKAEALRQATIDTQLDQAKRAASAPASKPIESYSITILNRDGWAKIFEFYFERNQEMGVDDFGKVKLESMKSWVEKYAKSTKEFIAHSSIRYEEKYKAVARAGKERKAA